MKPFLNIKSVPLPWGVSNPVLTWGGEDEWGHGVIIVTVDTELDDGQSISLKNAKKFVNETGEYISKNWYFYKEYSNIVRQDITVP